MIRARFCLLLLLALPAALAAQPCTKPGWNPLAPPVIVAQAQLLNVKLQDAMDEAVPAPLPGNQKMERPFYSLDETPFGQDDV